MKTCVNIALKYSRINFSLVFFQLESSTLKDNIPPMPLYDAHFGGFFHF